MMGVPPPPPFSYQFPPPPPPLPPGGSSPEVVGSRPSITTAATFPSPTPLNVAASAAAKRSNSSTGTTAGALSASSDEITMAIIKFIAGCGLPVMIVESNFFIDLIVALNRQYAHQYLTQLHANDLVRMWLPQLYASVHGQLVQQTRAADQNDVLHTMGGDGFFHDMVVSTTTARGEGNHRRPVHHLTDSVFHISSYFDCVESQHHDMQRCYDADNVEDAAATATATAAPAVKEEDLANVLIQRLEAKAKAEGKESVEDYFAAVVWDRTDPVNSLKWSSSSSSYPDDKLAATSNSLDSIVAKAYPRVFGNTCRIRSTNLLADDLGNIPEIRATMDSALQIATFVLSRPLVIQAYQAIQAKSESKGSLIKIIPPRRAGFCHADEMLQSLLGTNDENIDSLLALARQVEQWIADDEENCDLDRDEMDTFSCLVNDPDLWSKLRYLRMLTEPLSALCRHVTRFDDVFYASWIVPLYDAFTQDIIAWCDNPTVLIHFGQETTERVRQVVMIRWRGTLSASLAASSSMLSESGNSRGGLYQGHLLMATMLDPAFSPDLEHLPSGWMVACKSILKRFYPSDRQYLSAEGELLRLVDHQGTWGEQVQLQKKRLAEAQAESSSSSLSSSPSQYEVLKVISAQQLLADLRIQPHLTWKVLVRSSFPLLYEIARRVLVMGTQSSNVLHVCQPHKYLDHDDGVSSTIQLRDVLRPNSAVEMMLFTHVNLRLQRLQLHDKDRTKKTAKKTSSSLTTTKTILDHDDIAMSGFLQQDILFQQQCQHHQNQQHL